MTQYCLLDRGTLVDGPRDLPTVYQNISGFHLYPHPEEFGWVPLVNSPRPSYDPKTHRLVPRNEVQGNRVLVVWDLVAKTPEEIRADNPVPHSVTPAAAKMALFQAGIWSHVEEVIRDHPYAPVRIYFESAIEWRRDDPYIEMFGPEFGLTDEQIDDLFRQASQYD